MGRKTAALALAVAALAGGLAGCLDGPDTTQSDEPTDSLNGSPNERPGPSGEEEADSPDAQAPAPGGDPEPSSTDHAHVYRFPGGPVDRTLWRNGSFSLTDCTITPPELCPTGARRDRVAMTEALPVGTPVRVEVQVGYESSWGPPLASGSIRLELNTTAPSYDLDQHSSHGNARLSAVVARAPSDAVFLDVQVVRPEPSRQVDYTLEIELTGSPQRIPTGVPTAVPVPTSDASLHVLPANGPRTLRLWGPDDGHLGRVELEEGTSRLPAQLRSGVYVLVPVGVGDEPVSLSLEGDQQTPGRLSALPTTRERGEPNMVGPQGTAEWSFELDQAPLKVGLYAREIAGQWVYSGVNGTLSTNGTTVFSVSLARTGFHVGPGGMLSWMSSPDLVGAEAGSWTGRFEASPSSPVEVGHVVVSYDRTP